MPVNIDWRGLSQVPFEQTATALGQFSLQQQEINRKKQADANQKAAQDDQALNQHEANLIEKEKNERAAGIAQQNADTNSKNADTGLLDVQNRNNLGFSRLDLDRAEMGAKDLIERTKLDQAQQRINIDGTKDLGELAIKQRDADLKFNIENMNWQDMQKVKQMASENGIEGYQAAMIAIGQPEKAIGVSLAGEALRKSQLDNANSVFDIQDKQKQYETITSMNAMHNDLTMAASIQDPERRDNFYMELAKVADSRDPQGRMLNQEAAAKDPEGWGMTALHMTTSTIAGISGKAGNALTANTEDTMNQIMALRKSQGLGMQGYMDALKQERMAQKGPLSEAGKQFADADALRSQGRTAEADALQKKAVTPGGTTISLNTVPKINQEVLSDSLKDQNKNLNQLRQSNALINQVIPEFEKIDAQGGGIDKIKEAVTRGAAAIGLPADITPYQLINRYNNMAAVQLRPAGSGGMSDPEQKFYKESTGDVGWSLKAMNHVAEVGKYTQQKTEAWIDFQNRWIEKYDGSTTGMNQAYAKFEKENPSIDAKTNKPIWGNINKYESYVDRGIGSTNTKTNRIDVSNISPADLDAELRKRGL